MAAEAPLRLVHVITGLELGGAEVMLYELLKPFCLPDHEPCNYSDISQDE